MTTPERCPTCGSDRQKDRLDVVVAEESIGFNDSIESCRDPWHTPRAEAASPEFSLSDELLREWNEASGTEASTELNKATEWAKECAARAEASSPEPWWVGDIRWLEDKNAALTQRVEEAEAKLERQLKVAVEALEESVKLQSHYAMLLNGWDGGERIVFKSAAEWLKRLEALREKTHDLPPDEPCPDCGSAHHRACPKPDLARFIAEELFDSNRSAILAIADMIRPILARWDAARALEKR